MGPTSFRKTLLVPLLSLLLIQAAAAPNAEVLFRRAQDAWKGGDVKTTIDLASAALRQAGNDDSERAWRIRCLYADALMRGGNAGEAQKLLQRALPAKLTGTEVEVLRLRGLGIAAYRLTQRDASAELLAKAYELAQKHPRTLPSVLLALGTVEKKDAFANRYLRDALTLSRKSKDRATELNATGAIGVRLANAGQFARAIEILEPALAKARAYRDETIIQRYEGNLGWAYLELGDYEVATDYFTRALEKASGLGAKREVVTWTYQLGNTHLHKGDLRAAFARYQAAYTLAVEKNHDQVGIAATYLANASLLARNFADAHRYAAHALDARKADPQGLLRAKLMQNRILIEEAKFAEAKRGLKAILAATPSKQTEWETRAALARLHVASNEPAAAEEAFQKALKIVGSMRDTIGEDELRFAFFTSMTELFDAYVDFLIARGREEEALAVTEKSRAQTLEEGLEDIVERRDVRTIARDTGATILCYWLGARRSHLWVVTPKGVEAFPLPPAKTIEKMVDGYQALLLGGAAGTLERSASRGMPLWTMLVGPAAKSIPRNSRVIVVPDGRLHAFNMETLVVPSPRPHYWIEDVVISTAASLGLLMRKETPPVAKPRLLLVGNPPQPLPEFAKLPRAREEINAVARHFVGRATILSEAKATPSAYRKARPEQYTYLHFVAHGVATRLKPLDSAVVLAREGDDFKLYAREIAEQTLHARLVTISSCHGAGTRAYAGEGLVGLSWAFLHAGADNVIAALWEVSDDATPKLMEAFYARLVKGVPPSRALHDAKLDLLRNGGAHARPRYWATFLLYGSS